MATANLASAHIAYIASASHAAGSAGAPPPEWLDTLGKIAGVILGLELLVVVLIICGLMVGLAIAMSWVHQHVVPLARENAPKVLRAMDLTEQNTNRVVRGVAEFYGRRQAVQTGLRVLLFGRQSAKRARDEALIQAASDLQLMEIDASATPAPETGLTPRMAAERAGPPFALRRPAQAGREPDGHDRQNGYRDAHDDFSTPVGNAQ
jgi:hypothetical protein